MTAMTPPSHQRAAPKAWRLFPLPFNLARGAIVDNGVHGYPQAVFALFARLGKIRPSFWSRQLIAVSKVLGRYALGKDGVQFTARPC